MTVLIHQTCWTFNWLFLVTIIKRKILFYVATQVMFPWSFISLKYHFINCFLSQLGYLLSILLSWSNFYQLHVLVLTLRIHDIMIFERMNGKLPSKTSFWKRISCGKRKWWNGYSRLSRKIAIEKVDQIFIRNLITQLFVRNFHKISYFDSGLYKVLPFGKITKSSK